jgi:hypothetical protein
MFDPMLNGKLNKHIRECEAGGGSGGGLPVVEITTELNESTVQLSATENAALEAACGSPIIVNFADGSTLCEYVNTDGFVLFAPVSEAILAHWFCKTETGWVASTDV